MSMDLKPIPLAWPGGNGAVPAAGRAPLAAAGRALALLHAACAALVLAAQAGVTPSPLLAAWAVGALTALAAAWAQGKRGWPRSPAFQQAPWWAMGLTWAGAVWLPGLPLASATATWVWVGAGVMVAAAWVWLQGDRAARWAVVAPASLGLLGRIGWHMAEGLSPQAQLPLLLLLAAGWCAHRLAGSSADARAADGAAPSDHDDQGRDAERQALVEQNRLLNLLVRNTGEGFWFVAPDGATTDLNPSMCALLGRPREQVLGRTVFDFVDDDNAAILRRELQRRRQGHRGAYEISLRRPDGSLVACVNNATPIYGPDGCHLGSVGMWTDVSALKCTQARLQIYEFAINALPDAVSLLEDRGAGFMFTMVNDRWCRMTGLVREAVIGREVTAVVRSSDVQQRVAVLADCLRSGEARVMRSAFEVPGQAVQRLETWMHPIDPPAAGLRRVIVISRDISREERDAAELAASLDNLSLTLNTTGDGIFASASVSPDEPVLFTNDTMLSMWNIPAERKPRLSPADIVAHARPYFFDPDAETRRIGEIIASGQAHEDRIRLRDGRVLQRRCIPSVRGSSVVRVWGFRDVTTEQRALDALAAAEARQRKMLEAFPGYIACFDAQLHYQFVNLRFARVLGLEPDQMVGRRLGVASGSGAAGPVEAAVLRTLAGETVVLEHHIPASVHHAAITQLVTMTPGEMVGVDGPVCYCFGIDITALKTAQASLLALKDEAERANRAKSDFLSRMSHELRTPLNAILGFAQILKGDRTHPLPAVQRRQVREIIAAGQHLLSLINEVLDLARVEAGHLSVSVEPVALAALAEECLSLVAPLAEQVGVQVNRDASALEGLWVQADRTRLKQVLLNLLSNGIKYNQPGGWVRLGCRPEPDTLRIEVADNGAGLDAEAQARLFAPFERLDADARRIEGTGIGLALSRRLTELMHGAIGIDSAPGQGSCFWVRLPRAEPPKDDEAGDDLRTQSGAAAVAIAAAPCTVLYIEDTPFNVSLMEAALRQVPEVRLVTATEPLEGLALARALKPALVLLDIQLPGIDGFEVLRRLRSDAGTRHLVVVALSANAMDDDIRRARAAGFDDYLTKPIDLPRLLAVVRRAAGTDRATLMG